MSRPRNNQSRRISIYRLQRRPPFGFESSVSSTSMTSGDPVVTTGRIYVCSSSAMRPDNVYLHGRGGRRVWHGAATPGGARRLGHRRPGRHAAATGRDRRVAGCRRRVIRGSRVRQRLARLCRHFLHHADTTLTRYVASTSTR